MKPCLWALVACLWTGCQPTQKAAPAKDGVLRLAILTDLKGYLEPCGCTSRPLGGIDRTAAQIRALRENEAPLLFLLAGDSFFDEAKIDSKRLDQSSRNARTLLGILNELQVAAVLPGQRDRAQPAALLSSLQETSQFPWLAMNEPVQGRVVEAGSMRVGLLGVQRNAEESSVRAAVAALRSVDGAAPDLVVALVDGSRREAGRVAALEGVDFVVQGGLDEDRPLPPRRSRSGWVLHAGRQGQGLTIVEVQRAGPGAFADQSPWSAEVRKAQLDTEIADLRKKIEAWASSSEVREADLATQRSRLESLEKERQALDGASDAAATKDANVFRARWLELDPDSARDPEVVQRMKAHDKAVNEANRRAFADLKPPALEPGQVGYVGSAACAPCHATEHAWWRGHPHGKAYATLQERNKEFNLDCVGCHVTGYGQPAGSTVTHNLDGALVDVGCEACHGPGAAHAKDPTIGMVVDPPESVCVACHNEEHSDLFAYEAYKATLVVPGHGKPVEQPSAKP